MEPKLTDLLQLVEFTNLFASVYRPTILNKDGSAENNAQHSFQLALVGWYIAEKEKLELNQEKIIKYALVHDLVETYSGSYAAYSRTELKQQEKEAKEVAALTQVVAEFPLLASTITNYFQLQDAESKFIYALDKLLPIVNIEVNNNDFYFRTKTTYAQMLEVKDGKIATDKAIYGYFKLLANYLREEAKFFWPENQKRDYSQKKRVA